MDTSDKKSEKSVKPEIKEIGLALSGGGARGIAHLGAIRALEEFGIKPGIIAGVSAGSIVAAMYSAGISIDKIMSLFTDRKFSDFCEISLRLHGNTGFFSLDRFQNFIEETVAPYENLEELPIPTYLGVTNFDKGTQAEFHTGKIAPRVVASCSIPICFKPKVIDGVNYVDGGVVRNMPSWIIRDKCRRLIGVNVSPLLNNKIHKSITEIAFRTYNLMAKCNQRQDLEMCDLAVETPEIAHYQVFNLKAIKQVFISGYASMRHTLKRTDWVQQYLSDKQYK